jgi:nucleoside-diphosphate-sugar epimerase
VSPQPKRKPKPKAKAKARAKPKAKARRGLTVAVTGPTGDIGRSYLRALDGSPEVKRVLGMARRRFDPSSLGLKKTEYRQGDILDRDALDDLFAEADVVAHLAFIIVGSPEETRRVNLEGSRNVFEAAAAAPKCKRLVYTSSVAAYGFHDDNPVPLTEDVAPRGTEGHYYSAQKAELEGTLRAALEGSDIEAYLFRPCIVAGADAIFMLEVIPYISLQEKVPGPVLRLLETMPILRPVIPDPGVPFQLVHTEDVAKALLAGTLGRGEPGVYNLAADGELTASDLAAALGWYSIPVPDLAVEVTANLVSRLPFLPPEAYWVNAFTTSVVMDTSKARSQLRWRPTHDARAVLMQTVRAAREQGLVD